MRPVVNSDKLLAAIANDPDLYELFTELCESEDPATMEELWEELLQVYNEATPGLTEVFAV